MPPRPSDRSRSTPCGWRLRAFCAALLTWGLMPRQPALSAADGSPPASGGRVVTELSSPWKFDCGEADGAEQTGFDDSAWKEVTLPHTWNVADGDHPLATAAWSGASWYRCRYAAPPGDAGRCSFLQFDGANRVAEVYVNGIHIGTHRGGYAGFGFEITPQLKFGADNVIAVKVDNSSDPDVAPLSGDFTVFGGLYRPARVLVLDPVHITPLDHGGPGVYLRTTEVSEKSASLQITSKLRNDSDASRRVTVQTRILDAAGNTVQTLDATQDIPARSAFDCVQATTVEHPHLWNGRLDPYLYRAVVTLREKGELRDTVSQPLGFRFFRTDPERGFYLNGQPYDLHGFCLHEQRLGKGNAISDADRAQDMADVVESGATFVRLVHYQHAPATYRLADENGIVLWTEFGLIDKANDSAAFHDNLLEQLRELIHQNFNHPSVCMWGLQNEITPQSVHATCLHDLQELARREDPDRPTAEATNQDGNTSVDFVADLQAFNRYYGWYGGRNSEFGSFLDKVHASPKGAANPIGVSEYGAGAGVHQHEDDPAPPEPWGRWHPEEYQTAFHESTWPQLAARPYLWSKAIWVMYDFAAGWRTEGEHDGYNDKGLITADHQTRKDAFYYYKAQWSASPFVYVTGRRFAVRANKRITAKVYSNCDSVELILNGVSLGKPAGTPDHRFVVPIELTSGPNTLQAVGTKGGVTYTDTVRWEGAPTLTIQAVQPVHELTTLAAPGVLALEAAVTRDGAPPGPETRYLWTQQAVGKNDATFADPTMRRTTARFPAAGAYVVRLSADDGITSRSRDWQVVVDPEAALKIGLLGRWGADATAGSFGVSEDTAQISLAARIKLAEKGGHESANIVDLPAYRLYVCLGKDGNPEGIGFDARTGRGQWEWRTEGGVPGDGASMHVAVVYDRTTTNPPACYLDGVPRRLRLKNRGWGDFVANTGTGYIGNSKERDRGFPGLLDDLRLYKRGLTPGEAAVLAAETEK